MSSKLHPLVQKTKVELLKLDKLKSISWEEQKRYDSEFLPISVEPKLRERALNFMNDLIHLLEANDHCIKFDMNRCHVEMYGQLTEINLRQKYFRKRIPNDYGYSHNTFEKSNKLEFQIGSCYRKNWIDKETKTLEEYLPAIYSHIEKKSKEYAEIRERQRIQEEERKRIEKIEAEKAELIALENAKLEKLITDADNFIKASNIRSYIKSLQNKINQADISNNSKDQDYVKWANKKADEIDPTLNFKNE